MSANSQGGSFRSVDVSSRVDWRHADSFEGKPPSRIDLDSSWALQVLQRLAEPEARVPDIAAMLPGWNSVV